MAPGGQSLFLSTLLLLVTRAGHVAARHEISKYSGGPGRAVLAAAWLEPLEEHGSAAALAMPLLNPNDGLAEYDGGVNLDDNDYLYSLAFTGLPGGVLAAAVVLVSLGFCAARCCAACCWDFRGNQGLCPAPRTPYSKRHHRLLRLLLALLSLAALAGAGVVYLAMGEFRAPLQAVAGEAVAGVNRTAGEVAAAVGEVDRASAALVRPHEHLQAAARLALAHLSLQTAEAAEAAEAARDGAGQAADLLEVFLLACALLVAALALAGAAGALTHSPSLLATCFLVGCPLAAFAWTMLGAACVAGRAADSLAAALHSFAAAPHSPEQDLSRLLRCVDLQTTVATAAAAVRVVKGLVNQTNTALHEMNVAFQIISAPLSPYVCDPYLDSLITHTPAPPSISPPAPVPPRNHPPDSDSDSDSDFSDGDRLAAFLREPAMGSNNFGYPYYSKGSCPAGEISLWECAAANQTFGGYENLEIGGWCAAAVAVVEQEGAVQGLVECREIAAAAEGMRLAGRRPLLDAVGLVWWGFLFMGLAMSLLIWVWFSIFLPLHNAEPSTRLGPLKEEPVVLAAPKQIKVQPRSIHAW